MKPALLLLGLLLVLGNSLPASNGAQEVIPLASTVYSDMDLLYLLAGQGTPSGSRPWTKAEAQAILGVITPDSLGGAARSLYDTLASEVHEQLRWNYSDGFSLSAYADLSMEHYLHTNTSDFTSYGAWDYSYVDRKPLLRLRLDLAVSDFFYTYSDLQYGYGLHTKDDTLPSLGGTEAVGALSIPSGTYYIDEHTPLVQYQKRYANNLIPSSIHIDFQTPKRSVISLGSLRWNVTFSRDRIAWGNSRIGNFILDDHVDFQEFIRFATFSDHFKYEALVVFFDTYYSSSPMLRMLLAHRLEFRPWGKLSFAVSENVMYRDTLLDLRFLNPAFVYHNLNERGKFNAIAHVELAYVPVAGLRLYGQFALDQAVAPNEGANPELPSWALSFGADYAAQLSKGILQTSLEASMALPHMYRRDTVDFLMARRYASLNYWDAVKLDYIGSPYGGDAVVFFLGSQYRIPQLLSLALSVTGILKGQVDMFTPLNDSISDFGTTLFSKDVINTALVATFSGSMEMQRFISYPHDWEVYASFSVLTHGTYLQSSKAFGHHVWDTQLVIGTTLSL